MCREAAADARITAPLGLLLSRVTTEPDYFNPPPERPRVDPPHPTRDLDATGPPPEVETAVAELEGDPARAGELAALDECIADQLARTVPPTTAHRLMATEESRRSQRRQWWATRARTPA